MDKSASKVLIETVVRKTIREIKEAPERSTRNIVDMALQFSKGRFQKQFFSMLQDKLQNEHSAYYGLVRDVVDHVDTEHLVTFGMNLGYNSCTVGAETIRNNEKKLHCNIPWTVLMQIAGESFAAGQAAYEHVIREGAELGICSWILFADAQPAAVLPLIDQFPDCAFFLCCGPTDITSEFLDLISAYRNVMIVIRFGDHAGDACALLRNAKQLYSIYYPYSEEDVPEIRSGDLFSEMEQLHPVFSVLLARRNCPADTRKKVSELVTSARAEQVYQTMLWELDSDNRMVDRVISEEECSIYFDRKGKLCQYGTPVESCGNLFADPLKKIFQQAFAKHG